MSEKYNERQAVGTAQAQQNAKNYNSSVVSIPKKIRPNTKLHRVLSALLLRSYHRFEAERELHDHALHSTVSTIQNSYGIRVDRRMVTVPGFQNIPTRVARYWISSDQHPQAFRLLGVMGEVA